MSIEARRRSVESTARSPTARAPTGGRRPSVAPVGQPPTPTVPAWWRGVGASRRRAQPMPHRVCALRDRRAPSIRSIRVRTVTVPLRDGLFRRNVYGTPVQRCLRQADVASVARSARVLFDRPLQKPA